MEAVLSAQQHPRTRVPDPSDGPADTRPPAKQQPESQGPAGLVRSMLRTRTSRAAVRPNTRLAAWTAGLRPMTIETDRSRMLAQLGVVIAITSLVIYITWRILFTMPLSGWNLAVAWFLVVFEAFPVIGLTLRAVTMWNLDCAVPAPVTEAVTGLRAVVFIPTYNEPVEVIAPTIAAASVLEPAHETWVLDDGDRPWVRELCDSYGVRYVRRDEHTHAKAGNMNHALDLMYAEAESGAEPIDIVAVLDCDHVPLPHFLTATLGWFHDPKLALVQGPQTYYNSGAFDDDGDTGDQGVFFHVQLPARHWDGAGPFWCGSTSLIRVSALREVGGISTETIVEDMHTTLKLIRGGWKTAYHHQVLALGLAPDTPEQYLLQRRRWGMGSMQVLVHERLWAAKKWLSWRNFYEYLNGTVWWLEGIWTVCGFLIPAFVILSGAQVSTADPLFFLLVFSVMIVIRLWGVRRLFRQHMQWSSAFALRVLRIPVGIACLWWLVTRRALAFEVTPKAGANERTRGQVPRVLWILLAFVGLLGLYGLIGATGIAPWHTSPVGTAVSSVWLLLAGVVLLMGIRRLHAEQFATSRRNAHRVPVRARVNVNDAEGELWDISVGGAAVLVPKGLIPPASGIELNLPGLDTAVPLETVRVTSGEGERETASFRVRFGDWEAYRALSLWLFHTPPGVVDGLPDGVPAVALRTGSRRNRVPSLVAQYGPGQLRPELDSPARND